MDIEEVSSDSSVSRLIYSQYLAPAKPAEPSEEEEPAEAERLAEAYYPAYDYEYLGFFINLLV